MVRKLPKRAYEEVTTFEAMVVAYRMEEKDGGMIRLTLYVDDIGKGDWIMNCYPQTPVAIGLKALDYDNPDQSKVSTAGEKAVKRAGMLCRNKKFQKFMEDLTKKSNEYSNYAWGLGQDEKECIKALYDVLGINSRKELSSNHKKRDNFDSLVQKFEEWIKCH